MKHLYLSEKAYYFIAKKCYFLFYFHHMACVDKELVDEEDVDPAINSLPFLGGQLAITI